MIGVLAAAGIAIGLATAPAPDPNYRMVPVTGRSLDSLRNALGPERFRVMLKVNRVDGLGARRADSLVIPEPVQVVPDQPFPPTIAAGERYPKLVLVALRVQAFAAYEFGRLVRAGPISSGSRRAPTPRGLFTATWKARIHVSTMDSSWIMRWTVNFDSPRGYAFHQYALPGRPASHRCVRLLENDARWLHAWVDTWLVSADGLRLLAGGTPIVIVGAYDHGARHPWRGLPDDPGATRVSRDELAEAESLLTRLPMQASRESRIGSRCETAGHRRCQMDTRG